MKQCKKCKTEKDLIHFHRKSSSIDGLQDVCKECFKKANAEWYKNNKDRKLGVSKEWYEKNKQRKLNTQKLWVSNNYETYKESNRVRKLRRIARQKNAEGTFIKNDIEKLFVLQQGKCACCCKKLTKYHIDHIMPLSLGGSNWPTNLQLLCPHCNMSKHSKDPLVWANKIGKLL